MWITTTAQRAATRQLIADTLRLFAPPPRLTVAEWAERERWLAGSVTARPGKFRALPFQVEPMQSFLDPEVQSTVLDWASRMGKTETMLNLIGYVMDVDPSGILIMYPIVESAEKFSKKFLTPMLQSTPCLRGLVSEKSRDSGNTILEKQFRGGFLGLIGANSPSGLRQQQARVIIADEIDGIRGDAGGEGDALTLLAKRTEGYEAIEVYASTPTVKGQSRIEGLLAQSDFRLWYVTCPRCGVQQHLRCQNEVEFVRRVRWPEGHPEEAHMHCESCEAPWSAEERVSVIMNGSWKPTQPFRGVRGYHLSGLCTVLRPKKGYRSKEHQMADDYLKAKNSSDPGKTLRAWTNTFLSESYEDEAIAVSAEGLIARRETYPEEPLPSRVVCLTAGVDVQHDRLECVVVGWSVDEESWVVEVRILIGNPAKSHVWAQLDQILGRTWEHPSGSLGISIMCVDSSDLTQHVYPWVRPRQGRGVRAVKGSSQKGVPLIVRPRKSGVRAVRLVSIGTGAGKSLLLSRLQILEQGPGFVHLPMRVDPEWVKQMTNERWDPAEGKWLKIGQNEALDCMVYAMAAVQLCPISLKAYGRRIQARADTKSEPETPAAEKPPPAPRRSFVPPRPGGWVRGW